ncbi:hypothetical protein Moror_8401 [Moniliophthora roreri MCA 2997]|uniref:Uncharacterized protein n=1 Tax=Moniliophthora roreri (strain MCA 2997) TaxID=1381753 RepID=V2XMZ5_MONRO|nr:hypothetical protein Moror_8401 [Moniliophthora roreri MCA 2997]
MSLTRQGAITQEAASPLDLQSPYADGANRLETFWAFTDVGSTASNKIGTSFWQALARRFPLHFVSLRATYQAASKGQSYYPRFSDPAKTSVEVRAMRQLQAGLHGHPSHQMIVARISKRTIFLPIYLEFATSQTISIFGTLIPRPLNTDANDESEEHRDSISSSINILEILNLNFFSTFTHYEMTQAPSSRETYDLLSIFGDPFSLAFTRSYSRALQEDFHLRPSTPLALSHRFHQYKVIVDLKLSRQGTHAFRLSENGFETSGTSVHLVYPNICPLGGDMQRSAAYTCHLYKYTRCYAVDCDSGTKVARTPRR